eukprot:Pgem_evm2s2763
MNERLNCRILNSKENSNRKLNFIQLVPLLLVVIAVVVQDVNALRPAGGSCQNNAQCKSGLCLSDPNNNPDSTRCHAAYKCCMN